MRAPRASRAAPGGVCYNDAAKREPGVRSAGKIVTLAELADRATAARDGGLRVVHCHGVFDLLHVGHIRYLERAAELGDRLVVTVTPDRFVNKGPHRPAFPEGLRAESVASLACVDQVAINDQPTAVETLRRLRPTLYAKGAEFRLNRTPEILAEEAAAAEVGAEIVFIEDYTASSSQLLNQYFSPFGEEVDRWLVDFRARHPLREITGYLDAARGLRPLVVGEVIIDEYVYCSSLGRSSKSPIVAMQYNSHERFAGGTAALANHLAGFCEQVDLISQIGDLAPEEDWLRGQLKPNVNAVFLTKAGTPTITKRRYRESYFAQPLFELYTMNDRPLAPAEDEALCAALAAGLAGRELVVVADYGHGMISAAAVELLAAGAPFLALNTQTNAGNVGYNTVSKYSRADLVCLAEQELRLECRRRTGDLAPMVEEVARRLGTRVMVATRGSHGCLCRRGDEPVYTAPALAARVVDRVGAGDAFFALAALCAAGETPLDVLAFLGNVAGAEAAATIGNRDTLDALRLTRHVQSLLK